MLPPLWPEPIMDCHYSPLDDARGRDEFVKPWTDSAIFPTHTAGVRSNDQRNN